MEGDGYVDIRRPNEDMDMRERGPSYRRRDRSHSRSRDRSRDRKRYRDEHDDRYRGRWSDDEDSYRGRGRERPRRRQSSAYMVYLERVPLKVEQYDIICQFGKDASIVRDVRLFKRADQRTTNPYQSAVIEFYEKEDGLKWLRNNQDNFYLHDEKITLEGGFEREEPPERSNWTCFKCRKLNYSHRLYCIRCDCTRRESERLHGDGYDGRVPSRDRRGDDTPPANVLIIRGLSLQTLEKDIVDAVASVCPMRMNDVRVIRDRSTDTSRGFCFIGLNTIEEATTLMDKLLAQDPPFLINGRRVMVDYARPNYSTTAAKNPSNSVASAAIAQAQWSHVDAIGRLTQEPSKSSMQQAYPQQESVVKDQEEITQSKATTEQGVPSTYSYDETSGFYYDSNTGLYYDPKTQYHYNSQTGHYCYYDPTQLKYVPVDNEGNPTASSTSATAPTIGAKKSDDPLVTASAINAKKIAKNMERWAKSVNSSKSAQKQQLNKLIQQEKVQTTPTSVTSKAPEPIKVGGGIPRVGISLTSALSMNDEEKPLFGAHPVEVQDSTVAPPPRLSLPPGADTNPTHTDWDQLACLLCKRKFPSKEVLVKHQQLSDLHKQNLQKWKTPSSQQTKGQSTTDEIKYRDRAQERRNLVGTQVVVSDWKRKVEQERLQGPPVPYEQPTIHGLKEDNIGNKMLTAMGWSGGQGLGKANQGIVEPIKAEIRQGSAGLGSRGSTYGYTVGDDYRSNVRAMTQARFNETFEKL